MWIHEDYGYRADVVKSLQALAKETDGGPSEKEVRRRREESLRGTLKLFSLEESFADLTSSLITTAISLATSSKSLSSSSHHPLPPPLLAHAAQRASLETAQGWEHLSRLSDCLSTHFTHARLYHQFFSDARTQEEWMKAEAEKAREAVKEVLEKKTGKIGRKELQAFNEALENLADVLSRWRYKVKDLCLRSTHLVPITLRKQPITVKFFAAKCLVEHRSFDVFIQKNEEVQIIDKTDPFVWKVRKSCDTDTHLIPSPLLLIVGEVPEAEEAMQRLKELFEAEWWPSVATAYFSLVSLLNNLLDVATKV